jgi:uracil-DNA glycosylase family 4
MTGELDPLSELRFLTEALRAHAEWQQACGAAALPPADLGSAALGLHEPLPLARAMPALSSESALVASAPRASAPNQAPRQPLPNVAPAAATVAAQSPPLTGEERAGRLTVLAEAVKGCTRCVLHEERTQTVFARGNGSSGLCFVGEGPGADEDAQGLPFVGPAGQLLDRMIAAMGIARDDVYVCNIVKCRPPKNRTPEPEEMSACMPFLSEQLGLVEPQVIVALGKTAVQGLFGTAEGITRIRGRWRLYQGRVAVMPTFHPAYLLRNPAAKREVWADLQLVLKHLGRALPPKGG